ncbi:MAG: hypothetical protein Q8754_02950, partial [Sweet potato little leaf phytoplasma]|nr:hypothetical protein [Sweet potato little leaf phytoplasma]
MVQSKGILFVANRQRISLVINKGFEFKIGVDNNLLLNKGEIYDIFCLLSFLNPIHKIISLFKETFLNTTNTKGKYMIYRLSFLFSLQDEWRPTTYLLWECK